MKLRNRDRVKPRSHLLVFKFTLKDPDRKSTRILSVAKRVFCSAELELQKQDSHPLGALEKREMRFARVIFAPPVAHVITIIRLGIITGD